MRCAEKVQAAYELGQRDERERIGKHAKELHGLVLMLLDQMHGRAIIDLVEQQAHNPERLLTWWRDERMFLHIVIDGSAIDGEA